MANKMAPALDNRARSERMQQACTRSGRVRACKRVATVAQYQVDRMLLHMAREDASRRHGPACAKQSIESCSKMHVGSIGIGGGAAAGARQYAPQYRTATRQEVEQHPTSKVPTTTNLWNEQARVHDTRQCLPETGRVHYTVCVSQTQTLRMSNVSDSISRPTHMAQARYRILRQDQCASEQAESITKKHLRRVNTTSRRRAMSVHGASGS